MFTKPVKISAQKTVEGWLKDFKDEMVATVKKMIKKAYDELNKQETTIVRQEWVLNHCGQAIAVASMLYFTD